MKLVVAYDGTHFHGFAAQPEVRTVAGLLVESLATVLRIPAPDVELACAGRTDKGVHARGQVVSLDVPAGTDVDRLARAVNGLTAPEVVVRQAEVVADDFDARRSACWRTYRYTIVNRPEPDPFLARYAWWVPDPLDLSERPRNCLKRARVDTIGQLVQKSEDDLLAITNFGSKSLEEVLQKLDERGLSLRVKE